MGRLVIPKHRILILDGAMGTMIHHRHPSPDGNNDLLNITHPEVIAGIHREYIEAGADIIETNTFCSNSISQADYNLSSQAGVMAAKGAAIARKVADSYLPHRKIFVVGSVGPTSKSLSLSPEAQRPAYRPYSFDQMADAYLEQLRALVQGGVDAILLETCFDALNAKAAIYALSRLYPRMDFPLMVSASVNDASGRLLTGQTLEAFYTAVSHYPLTSFGLNCSFGAESLLPLIEEVASFAHCAVSCHPNAGLPNELGGYDQGPQQMARSLRAMARKGLINIAGGCCGSTPEHIRAISAELRDCPPRKLCTTVLECLQVSGLEAVKVDLSQSRFTNIGERTNVAGSRKFARLIAEHKYEEALQIAANQIAAGASIIDINMDDALLNGQAEMAVFTRHISNDPAVAKAALMIDSSHEETLMEGLKNAQGKSVVNSISLKDGEEEFLRKAREIHALGAAMVVMAFDEKGQALDFARKTEICARAYNLLTQRAGISPHDIIFDANILSIGTGIADHARYGVDFLNAVRWIKQNLKGALTSGGVSNLSFAFRGNNRVREAMHSVFLYHAVQYGLDMAIVNPSMLDVYDNIDPSLRTAIEDVIFDRDASATDRLVALASGLAAKGGNTQDKAEAQAESACISAEDRLVQMLVKGQSLQLEPCVMEVLNQQGSAVDVIENVLMRGMETVGEYFGQGKMFLPQVVRSAKVMKEAVDILQPFLQGAAAVPPHGAGIPDKTPQQQRRPKVLFATVKGDVHDIGKNIAATILTCNGFIVTDLGVMVEKERILAAARETGADIIAVSGLITPSLFQMEELCRAMASAGMQIPLFVGGATTSAIHTALRLAPLYGYVFHGTDASATALMAKRYMTNPERFIQEERLRQNQVRERYLQAQQSLRHGAGGSASSMAAQPAFSPESYLPVNQLHLPCLQGTALNLEDLLPHLNAGLVRVMSRLPHAEEVATEWLRCMDAAGALRVRASLRFVDAYRQGDDILWDEGVKTHRLSMLRQEAEDATTLQDGRRVRLSLADFVPCGDSQDGNGLKEPMGFFAITADVQGEKDLLQQGALNALADAASSLLKERLEGLMATLDGREAALHPKVILPAVGYACCPDHSLKADILKLLDADNLLGISLSEGFGMKPDASICGLVFMHPQACFPNIHRIGRKQYEDYCMRRALSEETGKMLLGSYLQK